MGSAVGVQVLSQDLGRAGMQRDETGEESKQGGLAGAVPTRQQHDLPLEHVEVHAGKRREATE